MSANENLEHYEPTTAQYYKFDNIISMSDEDWERKCCSIDDCSICDMAIHQSLLSTTKHTCVYGMTREQFEIAMDNADCDF